MQGFVLRPFDARLDLERVLAAYADPRERARFGANAPTGDVRAFDAWLAAQLRGPYGEFKVVCDAVTWEFAGFAYAYDMRLADGHCKICVYVAPEYQKAGLGGWLAVAFMDGLFAAYPLRKIYALVYAYNEQSLSSCVSAGFEEECRLRDYRYFDGAYHDCVVLSLTRERYGERLAPLVDGGARASTTVEGAGAREGAAAACGAGDGMAAERLGVCEDGAPACAAGDDGRLRSPAPEMSAREVRVSAAVGLCAAIDEYAKRKRKRGSAANAMVAGAGIAGDERESLTGGGVADTVLSALVWRCGREPEMGERLARDLGFDSFDMLSAAVEIEDALGCEIDASLLASARTVGDLCDAARRSVDGR